MRHDPEALAPRLGEREAEQIDVDRVAQRVAERLRTGDTIREPVVWRRLAAAAAAVVLLAGGTLVWRGAGTTPGSPGSVAAPVALGDLEPRVLTEVLDSLLLAAPAGELVASAILDDLDEQQLRELLATMEG